ncbi:DUF4880 domain-containing protein [Caulobacter segnis]
MFGERLSAERARALGQWLAADPRHAQAYDRAERPHARPHRRRHTDQAPGPRSSTDPALGRRPRLAARRGPGARRRRSSARPTVLESGRAVRTLALSDGAASRPWPRDASAEGRLAERAPLRPRARRSAVSIVRHADDRTFQVEAGQTRDHRARDPVRGAPRPKR